MCPRLASSRLAAPAKPAAAQPKAAAQPNLAFIENELKMALIREAPDLAHCLEKLQMPTSYWADMYALLKHFEQGAAGAHSFVLRLTRLSTALKSTIHECFMTCEF